MLPIYRSVIVQVVGIVCIHETRQWYLIRQIRAMGAH